MDGDDGMTMNVTLVRELLDTRGWTWERLATEMEMSKGTISRVVRGLALPSSRFVFALQRVFPEHRNFLFVKVGSESAPPPQTPADDGAA